MTSDNFDADHRLCDIKKQFTIITEIKGSLADHRDKYRSFSNTISIDSAYIFRCCDEFERSLLINCYTFIEQYFKQSIYSLLEKDLHKNDYINHFINNKLPEKKYSPNVKSKEIEKQIKEFLNFEFKFILNSGRDELKKYNNMIDSRHRYAHRGTFDFDFNNFNDIINVLEYLKYEIDIFLCNKRKRDDFQKFFSNLKNFKDINNIFTILNNPKHTKKNEEKREFKNKIKEIKKMITKFEKQNNLNTNIFILKPMFNCLIKLKTIKLNENILNSEVIINEFCSVVNSFL